MEIILMTKDEFIQYIEENQHLDTVDITVHDLDGVDIDGLITYGYLSKENVGRGYLKNALESYLSHLEGEAQKIYLAQKIISVESTGKEYLDFKERFFSVIGVKASSGGGPQEFLDFHEIYFRDSNGKDASGYLWMGQTKNLAALHPRLNERSGTYLLTVLIDSDGFGGEMSFSYNKNKKFFFTGDGPFEWIATFTGME
jgi:hypothetical protein